MPRQYTVHEYPLSVHELLLFAALAEEWAQEWKEITISVVYGIWYLTIHSY